MIFLVEKKLFRKVEVWAPLNGFPIKYLQFIFLRGSHLICGVFIVLYIILSAPQWIGRNFCTGAAHPLWHLLQNNRLGSRRHNRLGPRRLRDQNDQLLIIIIAVLRIR